MLKYTMLTNSLSPFIHHSLNGALLALKYAKPENFYEMDTSSLLRFPLNRADIALGIATGQIKDEYETALDIWIDQK